MTKQIIYLNTEYLETLQRNHGYTNAYICKLADGISEHQMSRVKTGKAKPGVSMIGSLLLAFPEAKFEDLFFVVDPAKESLQTPKESQVNSRATEVNLEKKGTYVRLYDGHKAKMKELADATGRSLNSTFAEAVSQYLDREYRKFQRKE